MYTHNNEMTWIKVDSRFQDLILKKFVSWNVKEEVEKQSVRRNDRKK